MKLNAKIMISRIVAALACGACFSIAAAPVKEMPARAFTTAKSAARPQFRAPALVASTKVTLGAMSVSEKALAATPSKAGEPLRIGAVRALAKSSALETWTPVDGGFATRMQMASEGALGIRVKLELAGVSSPLEVRVQGNDGRVEWRPVDPAKGSEAWTPWTEGPEQMIEVFSPVALDPGAVRATAVVHFTDSPFTKAAASCTLSTSCTTGDATLDTAMADRTKSVARMNFMDGTGSFLCTGTLINSERFPSPFFMTAHHCVNSPQAAGTLTYPFRRPLRGPSGDDSRTQPGANTISGVFIISEPQIDQCIRNAAQAADDAPNRARNLFNAPFTDPTGFDKPLNERTDTLALDNRRIDYVGDLDVYRFRLTRTAWMSTWTEGQQDTLGSILDSRGVNMVSNDDWQQGAPYNFGITQLLQPGTYYVQVGHWEPTGTGVYNFRMRADVVDANYTALWWNPAENGWGLNVSHQGNTLFGTLYTYGPDGKAVWYSMSSGVKQADGSYLGSLVLTTGPAFNASPWNAGAVSATVVGQMRLAFADDGNGSLTYNVGGATVTKTITKLDFAGPPTCTWSASNRSRSTNFQDLWWGGLSESGWGVNVAHQGNKLFATLFTYDASGQPLWLVMSDGSKTSSATYTGALYRSTGPAFNAVPFTPITPANLTQVGTMTFVFTDGDTATLSYTVNGTSVTKNIQRLEFGAIKPLCSQGT